MTDPINQQAEPLEQQLDSYVRVMTIANTIQPKDAAMLATIRDIVASVPGLNAEIKSARNQRDYMGHQLSDRISRFHALRVAFGETSLDTAARTVAAELNGIEQACQGIAKQAGVEV